MNLTQIQRLIVVVQRCLPTLSADKNCSCVLTNHVIFMQQFFSHDKKWLKHDWKFISISRQNPVLWLAENIVYKLETDSAVKDADKV